MKLINVLVISFVILFINFKFQPFLKQDPLDSVLERANYVKNIAIYKKEKLFSDQIGRNEVGIKLKPFVHAVNGWSKLLAVLLSKIDNPSYKYYLVDNLSDEICGPKTHVDTYLEFLNVLMKDPLNNSFEKIDQDKRVDFFIDRILQLHDPVKISLVMGMIEYVYIDISLEINNYLKKNDLYAEHYKEHEVLDVKHSTDLFNLYINLSYNSSKKLDQEEEYYYLHLGEDLIYGLMLGLLT